MLASIGTISSSYQPGLLSGIIAYWKLDESSGTLFNSVQASINMTANNTPTYGTTGIINTALSFAALSSEYLDSAHNADFNSSSYTISAWVKRASITTTQMIFAHDDTGVGYAFYFGADNKIRLVHQLVLDVGSDGTITDTSGFHHVAIVYNGSVAAFYIDGAASGAPSIGAFNNATTTETIACNKNIVPQLFFDGVIDEVGVWSRTLRQGEITELYNSGAGLSYPF